MADEEDELVLFDDAVADDDDDLNVALAEAQEKVVTTKAPPVVAVAPKDVEEEEDSFFDNVFQDDDEAPREAHGDVLPPNMEIEGLLLKHDLTREYMTPIIVNKSSLTFGPRMENDRSVIAFKKSLNDQALGEEELALRQRIWTRYKEMVDDLQEMSAVNLSKSVSNFYDDDNNRRQRSRVDDDDDDDDDDINDIEKFKKAPPPRRKRAADYFIKKPTIVGEVSAAAVEESSVLKNTFEQLNDEEDEDDLHYFARIEGEGEEAVVEEISDDGLDKRPRLENRFIMQVEEGGSDEEDDGDVEIYDEDDKGKEEEAD